MILLNFWKRLGLKSKLLLVAVKKLSLKNALIFVLAIALFMSIHECKRNEYLTNSKLNALTSKTTSYKNKIGTLTASKKVLQLEKSELKELVFKKDDTLNILRKEFSKVKAIVKTKTVTIIDSIPVPFEIRVPCDFERKGKHLDKWLQFDYAVNQDGFNITNFIIPNEQTTITGFKRKWFLGRQTLTTDITNSNPNIQTTDVQTIQVVVPKRWYDTRGFNIGLGAFFGFLATK